MFRADATGIVTLVLVATLAVLSRSAQRAAQTSQAGRKSTDEVVEGRPLPAAHTLPLLVGKGVAVAGRQRRFGNDDPLATLVGDGLSRGAATVQHLDLRARGGTADTSSVSCSRRISAP